MGACIAGLSELLLPPNVPLVALSIDNIECCVESTSSTSSSNRRNVSEDSFEPDINNRVSVLQKQINKQMIRESMLN